MMSTEMHKMLGIKHYNINFKIFITNKNKIKKLKINNVLAVKQFVYANIKFKFLKMY